MSAADYAWRLFTIVIIGGSGTVTGFFASDAPFFKELGIIAWVAVGLICSISIALIFYLIKSAQNQSANAEYTRTVSQPKNRVNPLMESFKDQIIPIEELRVPGTFLHKNKHFKRCVFVGPGALALLGGTFIETKFIETGDIIPMPDNTRLTGIIGLENCTVENCEFHRITIMVNQGQASTMAKSVPGMTVAGS